MPVDYLALLDIGRQLLVAIGEDPSRPGLVDTPRRWASWWQEFIDYDPGNCDTVFESVVTDQMVVVSGMKVWSLCEHHLLPFWCDVSVGYIAKDRIIGLSKAARIAHAAAHKLQVQERLVQDIADSLERLIGPDVAVLAQGTHTCMIMRGIRTPGVMSSSVMRGAFFYKPEARAEFLQLVDRAEK